MAAVLAAYLCLSATTVRATAITYTFSGVEGGLFGEPAGSNFTGGLVLNGNASRSVTTWGPDNTGTLSTYSSSLQPVSGTLGDCTFSGIADVYVSDGPAYWSDGSDNVAPDYWIVRADVSGPAVDGLTPTHLNLFYYIQPEHSFAANPFPPFDPLSSVNDSDFQFTLSFIDGEGTSSFVDGRLFSLQSVPEPSKALLFLMAFGMLGAGLWRSGSGRTTGWGRINL
jgi:hypothetical protein